MAGPGTCGLVCDQMQSASAFPALLTISGCAFRRQCGEMASAETPMVVLQFVSHTRKSQSVSILGKGCCSRQ